MRPTLEAGSPTARTGSAANSSSPVSVSPAAASSVGADRLLVGRALDVGFDNRGFVDVLDRDVGRLVDRLDLFGLFGLGFRFGFDDRSRGFTGEVEDLGLRC